MFFILLEVSYIHISIRVYLHTMATFVIVLKVALIDFALVINEYALALPHIADNSPKINLIGIFDQPDFIYLLIDNLFNIDIGIGEWVILHEEITQLFLIFTEQIFDTVLLITDLQSEELMIQNGGVCTLYPGVVLAMVDQIWDCLCLASLYAHKFIALGPVSFIYQSWVANNENSKDIYHYRKLAQLPRSTIIKMNSQLGSGQEHKGPNYEALSKQQLITELKQRDKQLMGLKEKLLTLEKGESERMGMLKLKLEEEIAQNEKAVKAFASITEIVITMIQKFEGLDRLSTESKGNMVGNLRQTIMSKVILNDNVGGQKEEEIDQESEFSCIDEIVSETIKLLDYMSKLTEDVAKTNVNLKTQLAKKIKVGSSKADPFNRHKRHPKEQKKQTVQGTSDEKNQKNVTQQQLSIKDSGQISNPTNRSYNEQIKQLKEQIQLKVKQAKDVRKLLEQEQQRRTKLIKNILNCLSQQLAIKIASMDREELIQHIKMMSYRVKELQRDKREMFAKAKVEKEMDQRRFQDLLQEIKQVKSRKLNYSIT